MPRSPILLAVRGLDPVGTGRQVELLALGFRDAGRDVHVALTTAGGGVARRLARAGIPVHRVGRRPLVPDAAAAARLAVLARLLRPAVLLACGRSALPAAAAVALAAPATHVAAQLAVSPRRRGHAWALRRLGLAIATTPHVAEACRRAGVAAERVVTIPPGIAADPAAGLDRAAVAARLGLDAARRWTLCVTPLDAEARIERLAWGIDQLGVVRRDVQHVVVGAGPLRARLLRRARLQEFGERMVLVPRCHLLNDLLGHVAIVWQSGGAAHGGAILDGMARGVPAVAVDGDAARQLVVDGVTGRIVPPLPESEFPRRAFDILEDDALAARWAAASLARADAEFPAGRMVEAHLAALARLE
ncbi:MAG: glycosyltransferase [Planctomycetaceae bacterium]